MTDLKQIARTIFQQALADCSIPHAFDSALHISADRTQLIIEGLEPIALDRLAHIRIVALGKAAAPMLTALLARLPLPPSTTLQGILIAPEPPAQLPASIQYFAGGHPSPNEASFAGASAALSLMRAAAASPADTLCIFLVSGGASAMMELPLDPAISLADTIAFHRALVGSGANIVEMNCVRKHFSAVKGGRLALASGAAQKLSLLVSDVPPARIDALASGPTIPDPSTVDECREILARYSLLKRFPEPVHRFFNSPDLPETPKPAQLHSPCTKLLDSDVLAHAAQRHAAALGFHTVIDNSCDDAPYDVAADYLLRRLRELRAAHPRTCLVSVGEIAVKLPPSAGVGGRNQHFALHAATRLTPSDGPTAILSAGSDGIDGNSPAAGAVLDSHTLNTDSRRLAAERVLNVFDSYTWLNALGTTITTGPTGQNLRDLRILLASPVA